MISDIFPRMAPLFFRNVVSRGDPAGIYLTFDDGPDPVFTPKILDLLEHYNCHATFFVTGRKAEKHPDIVRAANDAGHTIGSHGYTHRSFLFAGRHAVLDEINRSASVISDITGFDAGFFRPPHGLFKPSLPSLLKGLGMKLVLWSLSPADFVANPPTVLERRIVRRVRAGDIVLLHDGGKWVDNLLTALPRILERLTSRGLALKALSPPTE